MLQIGVLGSGNFGGQVANLAVQEGFAGLALNASTQDLELLDSKVTPFLIGDGNGTGKSAEYAEEFLNNHLSFVKDKDVITFIDTHDVIIMAGSAGGGFGSNTIPTLTQILSDINPDKLFIPLTVLPDSSETYTAQVNTQTFMATIVDMNVPYIVYDNDKFNKLSPAVSSEKLMKNIALDLRAMSGEFIKTTRLGGIDNRDLLTALSVPGRLVISTIIPFDESDIIEDSIIRTLKKTIDDSAHARLVDDKNIMASAIMYNINDDVDKYTSNIKSDLQDIFGTHITDYRNEAINQEGETCISLILSGLNLPTTRIDRLISRIDEIDEKLATRKKASSKLNAGNSKYKLNAKSFGGTTPAQDKSNNVDDILKRYVKHSKHVINNNVPTKDDKEA